MKTYLTIIIVLLALTTVACKNTIKTGFDYQPAGQVQQNG